MQAERQSCLSRATRRLTGARSADHQAGLRDGARRLRCENALVSSGADAQIVGGDDEPHALRAHRASAIAAGPTASEPFNITDDHCTGLDNALFFSMKGTSVSSTDLTTS